MGNKPTDQHNIQQPTALILWIAMILVLLAPLLLSFFPSLDGEQLHGVGGNEKQAATLKNYWDGTLQKSVEGNMRERVGMANYWVRLHNELNFRIFRHTNAEKVVLGKDDCFYEEMYITEYLGRNFIGDEFVKMKVDGLKRLQTLLHEQYGTELVVVFEPGKASLYPEFIPERYHPENKSVSNYTAFVRECEAAHIGFLDLNAWFQELKPTAPHKLYSKYGVHWSSYGLWLAADTLAAFIERQCGLDLPEIIHEGDSNSFYNKDLDFDMEPSMNLLSSLPHERMNFPICRFHYDPEIHRKPRALTIADSYYWSIWNSGISENLFADNPFWYYNRTVYPDIWGNAVYPDKSRLKEIVEEQEVVILSITDANLYDFGWGFVEEALSALDSSYRIPQELTLFNQIMADRNRYQQLLKQSVRERRPFAEVLKDNAKPGLKGGE